MSELLANLGKSVLLAPVDLLKLVKSAPMRYKVYQIPKKAHGQMRTIAQPAREVKALQYWVMREVLSKYKMNPAAMGYRKGTSIADNARPHVRSRFLLKMDLKDFFPSLRERDWQSYARKYHLGFTDLELEALTRILFWRPRGEKELRLSIGAPSSPLLSNILMNKFDEVVSTVCLSLGVQYTRYADDMSFSSDESYKLQLVEQKVIGLCAKLRTPRLTINQAKTVRVSKREARRVTGLVLSNDGQISLGRDVKRRIRASVHHYVAGRLPREELGRLGGTLAFVNSVEPSFLDRLRATFGSATVRTILSSATLPSQGSIRTRRGE